MNWSQIAENEIFFIGKSSYNPGVNGVEVVIKVITYNESLTCLGEHEKFVLYSIELDYITDKFSSAINFYFSQ